MASCSQRIYSIVPPETHIWPKKKDIFQYIDHTRSAVGYPPPLNYGQFVNLTPVKFGGVVPSRRSIMTIRVKKS